MPLDFKQLADAWARDDRAVLDTLNPAQRRAVSLIASGVPCEAELEPAGAEIVRGVKASPLYRLTSKAAAPKNAGENRLAWIYSDETVDRAGDIIRQNWELGNYKQNPVVLWGHGREEDEPIGRTVAIGVDSKQLVGTIEFAVAESERAARLYRLANGGFIKAGSVGFRPLETRHVEDPSEREKLGLGRWGVVFERSELLEFSLCAVPCNPNAIQEGVKSKAILEADADLLAALSDPTEREWEKYVRRRARAFVALGTSAPAPATAEPAKSAEADSAVSVLRGISDELTALREAHEDDAASRRMLARALTDLSAILTSRLGAPRAVDSARSGADAKTITATDAEKIRKQLETIAKTI